MWPLLLDLTKDECKRMLRRLELEAYSSIITAFRAQGDLSKDKKKVLQDLGTILGISTERHRAEIRRAVNDEHLTTIADQVSGCSVSSEWAMEGRRLVPLMPRLVPQTAFSVLANSAANVMAAQNALLPAPSCTSNKRENAFNIPTPVSEQTTVKAFDSAVKGVPLMSPQDIPINSHLSFERENPIFSSTMPIQEEIFAQHARFSTFRNSDGISNKDGQTQHTVTNLPQVVEMPPSEPAQPQVPPPLPPPITSTGNLVILPGRTPIGVRDGEKGRRYRRSSLTDTHTTTTVTSQKVPHPTPNVHGQQSSAPQAKGAAPSTPSASSRTVGIPVGNTPVQFTVQGINAKSTAASVGNSSSPPQKVILVSTAGSNMPSSILQRSLGVPVVKTVTTSAGLTLATSKPTTSLIAAGSVSLTTSSSATTGTTSTPSQHEPSGAVPAFTVPPIMSSGVATGSRESPALASGPATGIVTSTVVGTSQAQNTKGIKRVLGPVTSSLPTSTSASTQVMQIKTTASHGLKFITHALPSGTKLIPKSSGGSGPPIMVVTKTGSQAGTRLVNVLTTQSSTGMLMVPTTLTVSRTSGNPTLVTVGSKGKQAALVKVSPAMSLSTTGGKPNVILVQKAHVMSHSTTGNTITVSASSLSAAAAQTVLKSATGATFTYGDKVPKKSTVLADILQAAGILPEGSSASEVVVGSQSQGDGAQSLSQKSTVISKMVPSGSRRKSDASLAPTTKTDPKPPMMGLVVNSTASKSGRPKAMNLQQIHLPFDIKDAQILEIQGSGGLVTSTGKLSSDAINLLQQSNLQVVSSLQADSSGSTDAPMEVDEKKIVKTFVSVAKPTESAGVSMPENVGKKASADTAVAVTPSTSTLRKPNKPITVPLKPMQAQTSHSKIETGLRAKDSGELDPRTGLFCSTVGISVNKSSCKLVEKKVCSLKSASSQIESNSKISLPTSPAVVEDVVSKTASGDVQSELEASSNSSAPENVTVVQTEDSITPTLPTTVESIQLCSVPKLVGLQSTTKSGDPENPSLFMEPSVTGGALRDDVTDKQLGRLGTVATATAAMAAASRDALSKLLYRGATYSREDAALRKKTSSAESVPETDSSDHYHMHKSETESATTTPSATSKHLSETMGISTPPEEATLTQTMIAHSTETAAENAESVSVLSPTATEIASIPDESIPEGTAIPEKSGGSLTLSHPVAWSISDSTTKDDTCGEIEIATDISEPSTADQVLLVEKNDCMGDAASDLIESLADTNPNVTVELIPIAPFEYAENLNQVLPDAEALPEAVEESFVHDATETVVVGEEVMFSGVADDHITFSDEVVTVELEYDSLAVDQFVSSEVVGDVVFDGDDGLDAMLEHLDPERGGGQTDDDADRVVSESTIIGDNSDDLALDPEMARAVSESLSAAINLDSTDLESGASALTSGVSIQTFDSSGNLHLSGSSMFMVTDSVSSQKQTEHEFVTTNSVAEGPDSAVSLSIDCLPEMGQLQSIEMCESSATGQMTTSVICSEEHLVDNDFMQQSTSTPGKRKRKPNAIYSPEENLNIPHLSGWARSAMGLLLRVTKFRGHRKMKGDLGASHWFLNPVTPEEAPGYHQIVLNPMDFSTIKTKLETLCYKNISDFHADMMLVKANCELYNPPEHDARKDCEEVFHFYLQEYERLIEKWQKAHLFSSSQKKTKLSI